MYITHDRSCKSLLETHSRENYRLTYKSSNKELKTIFKSCFYIISEIKHLIL